MRGSAGCRGSASRAWASSPTVARPPTPCRTRSALGPSASSCASSSAFGIAWPPCTPRRAKLTQRMDPTPPPAYRASVPAVARAVRALEHLASAQQPLSLSVLARAGNISPSSLLAILTTLRATGLVSRSPKDGRYLPGPGLVALGTAAAQCLQPLHAFDMLANDLV